ncbi:MAG TPA: hypothetical protein VHF69_14470, partial [Candidatus Synoicihabitans sp.]|nr:hypothetical protein [Candidatus Synoicihabitans sp.]
RMTRAEREPKFLIEEGYLERCEDFEYEGKRVLASRLGYRITPRFVRTFFGRVFNHPHVVFTEEMLRPELQDLTEFVDGMDNICETHRRVAQSYFDDGTIEMACPPLRALLHIMAGKEGTGPGLQSPELRSLFTREALLASEWYAARLAAKQQADIALWDRHVHSLELMLDQPSHADVAERMKLKERLAQAQAERARVATGAYRESLIGTLGRQPL